MQALVLVHLFGMSIFLGGTFAAFVVHRVAVGAEDPAVLDRAQITVGRASDLGLLLVLLSGVALLLQLGMTLFHQPWLHLMLTGFVIAGAASGMATARTRRLRGARGEAARGAIGVLRLVALAAATLALAAGAFKWGA